MSNIFDEIVPYIEYVDPLYFNKDISSKVSFKCKGDPTVVIKWCRRNFGNRGDGWDFVGTTRQVTVTIWSEKLKVMWELWQE